MNRKYKQLIDTLELYCSLLAYIPARNAKNDHSWPRHQWILGHRGAPLLAAENTLSSFRQAMACGADGVEFDVLPSRDGVPMVIHDYTLDRTTDKSGIVWHYDADVLMALNATKLVNGMIKEGIPTLKDTLATLPQGTFTNIELKSNGHLSKEDFVMRVLRVIVPHMNRLRILVSSFDPELLKFARAKNPKLMRALLLCQIEGTYKESLRSLPAIKPHALHIPPNMATTCLRFLARLAHMRVAIWTINDPEMARDLFSRGVDGIFTDRVLEIVQALRVSRGFITK